ncbi:MAG TPA: LysR substrate-binding domain-containing protein [Jiangellaceae bacterium]
MELRSLRYVVTLAEELHFGRAAQRHYIAAQAFGRHVQRLERELGYQLFARTSRQVRLTPAGELFVRRVRTALATIDSLLERVTLEPPGDGTPIRLGILGFGAADLWQSLLDVALAQHPGLRLVHSELDMPTQYDTIRSGEVDVGIVHYLGPLDGLTFQVVMSVPRVVIVPATSPFADADRLSPADLDGQPWIQLTANHPGLAEWAGPAGEPNRSRPLLRTPSAAATAVATTGSLALHGEPASRFYPHPDVRFIPLDGPPVEVAIATREDDDRPAASIFHRAAAAISAL